MDQSLSVRQRYMWQAKVLTTKGLRTDINISRSANILSTAFLRIMSAFLRTCKKIQIKQSFSKTKMKSNHSTRGSNFNRSIQGTFIPEGQTGNIKTKQLHGNIYRDKTLFQKNSFMETGQTNQTGRKSKKSIFNAYNRVFI